MNLNARYQKIRKIFQTKYDPNTYWSKLGRRIKAEEVYAKPHKLEMKMRRVNALLELLGTIRFNSESIKRSLRNCIGNYFRCSGKIFGNN